jgi:hypothetical protein
VENRQVVLRGVSKVHPDHPLQGIKVVSGNAPYQRSTAEVEGAEWTGRDPWNHRLVFAARGRIFARTGGRDVELADFNDEQPDPQPPPEQAKRAIR